MFSYFLKFAIKHEADVIPISLYKLDISLLSFIRFEVDARLEAIHFEGLVDTSLRVQIWKVKV